MVFHDIGEIEHALFSGAVTLHAKVEARYKTVDQDGKPITRRVEVDAGPHDDRRNSAAQSQDPVRTGRTVCCASRRSAS